MKNIGLENNLQLSQTQQASIQVGGAALELFNDTVLVTEVLSYSISTPASNAPSVGNTTRERTAHPLPPQQKHSLDYHRLIDHQGTHFVWQRR